MLLVQGGGLHGIALAETSSRCVTFASRTAEAGDGNHEMSNEDAMCEVDIQDDPEYSAHEYWNLDSSKAASMFLL